MENASAPHDAARALLAFWRAAGVDMDEAEAVYATAPVAAPAREISTPVPKPKPKVTAADASVETAKAMATAAKTIAELRAAVENFDGCALKRTARNTVFCDGVDDAQVLLIGEAPGKDEDEQGKPFVGRPGQLLDRMLAQIGLDRRTNILISNTIYWRPPGNRDPTQGEIVACLPFVERMIELSQVQFDNIYARLGITFDHTLGESFYNPWLKDIVTELAESGIARTSEGAIAIFSDGSVKPEEDPFRISKDGEWKDAPALIQKADGASNYATTDLATLRYRMTEWQPDEIIYVTDGRQQLHFRQIFSAFRRWKPDAQVKLAHVWFGSILGEDGKPFKTMVGVQGKDTLKKAIDEALN